jgi:plastocyanin
MLALEVWQLALIGVATIAVVALLVFTTLVGLPRFRRRRGDEPDIPPGMRSGPTDQDLERPILERLQAWGILLVVVMGIWVPVVWLQEPNQNKQDLVDLEQQSVERGKLTTEPNSEENGLGFNCERCHGRDLTGGQNYFNGSVVPVPNLHTVCGGSKFGHPLITSVTDIVNTIAQGRGDMPSWSVQFKGAMDDQQITDLVNYIISIQDVPKADNLCTNPQAVASASPSASPSPSPSASASASASPSASPSGTQNAVQLTAQGIAFHPTTLTAPANTAFTIDFMNQDAGTPHNVAIFNGQDENAPKVFTGDIATGPTTVSYSVPALKPGTYFFHCDVHPTMTGTLTVK